MISAVVSSLHLLALAVGLPAVFLRGRALKGPLDADGVRRAFGGLEKGTEFYLRSPLFWTKMALFLLILLLEIRPMVTFIRWRAQLGRGLQVDTSSAPRLYTLNHIELALVVVMVFVAGMMARGIGF